MDDRWLTTEELAERLRTSPGSIREMRRAGRGPKGTRLAKRVLYRLSDVTAWEKEREAAEATRAVV